MRAIEELRPLTAGALLGLWQAHREAYDDPLERTLRCNAAILQASLLRRPVRAHRISRAERIALLRGKTPRLRGKRCAQGM